MKAKAAAQLGKIWNERVTHTLLLFLWLINISKSTNSTSYTLQCNEQNCSASSSQWVRSEGLIHRLGNRAILQSLTDETSSWKPMYIEAYQRKNEMKQVFHFTVICLWFWHQAEGRLIVHSYRIRMWFLWLVFKRQDQVVNMLYSLPKYGIFLRKNSISTKKAAYIRHYLGLLIFTNFPTMN